MAERKIGQWKHKHGGKAGRYLLVGGAGLYLYAVLVNSIRLGIEQTFGTQPVDSIFIWNLLKSLAALFTPIGLGVSLFVAVAYLSFTKKGHNWLTRGKLIRDPRGFTALKEGTHGTSGWMEYKDFHKVFEMGTVDAVKGTLLGKYKESLDDPDRYADYMAARTDVGLNPHTLIIGTSGTGKSRGFIRPFALKCLERRESLVLVDTKGDLYESLSSMFEDNGYTVKALNLLDMEYSDAWNVIADIETDSTLVPAVAEVIIKNTSNVNEKQDFWGQAEQNLLMALLHYVTLLCEENTSRRLPIQDRSLGTIYELLSAENFDNLDRRMYQLPNNHPAKAPYGIFRLANRQIWGNIAIGLGNRLSVFQNENVDRITRFNEIDLELPGKQPCAYFVIISDQDSSMEFMSSMFFSLLFARLTNYARRHGENGQLPVPVNVCLDEFLNCGKLLDFKRTLGVARSRRIYCQLAVQSLSGLADRYPKKEWEELVALCDIWQFLGCNDLMTADYLSEKCGMMSIQVQNTQRPVTPIFSPSRVRPYSETRSSFKRPLMLPDEIMRLPNEESIILLRGQKPVRLWKLVPEELPQYAGIRKQLISDHIPAWRQGAVQKRHIPPAPPPPPEEGEAAKPPSPPRREPRPPPGKPRAKPNIVGQFRFGDSSDPSVLEEIDLGRPAPGPPKEVTVKDIVK